MMLPMLQTAYQMMAEVVLLQFLLSLILFYRLQRSCIFCLFTAGVSHVIFRIWVSLSLFEVSS